MAIVFQLFGMLRRSFYRFRRFWRSVYYGITNLLMIIGGAALIFAVWYFSFGF